MRSKEHPGKQAFPGVASRAEKKTPMSKRCDQPACSRNTTIDKRLYRPRLAPLTREHQRCCSSNKAKEGCCILAGLSSLQKDTACAERVHLVVLFCFCDRQLVFNTVAKQYEALNEQHLRSKLGQSEHTFAHHTALGLQSGFCRVEAQVVRFRTRLLVGVVEASLAHVSQDVIGSWRHCMLPCYHTCTSQLPSAEAAGFGLETGLSL